MDEIRKINTISETHDLIGYAKPNHPLISVIDFSKIDTENIQDHPKTITGFYSIHLKNFNPTCNWVYGRKKFDFQEGTLVFLAPGQVTSVQSNNSNNERSGWALLFHPDLIRGTQLGEKIKNYTFFSYDVNEALHLSEQEKVLLTELVKTLEHELNTNIDKHSKTLLVSNVELILNYCNRYYDRQFITRSNENKDVIVKLEKYLDQYFDNEDNLEKGIPAAGDCAQALNISTNYLGDLLRKETGKNTQEHIHTFIIERAKSVLLSSNSSVKEIAYELGFNYPQYFNKLFKQKTGLTPAEYRKFN